MTIKIHHDFRTWRFWRHFLINGFSAVGAFSIVIGIMAVTFPSTVSNKGALIAVCVPIVSVLYGAIRSWPQPIQETYNSPNVQIRVAEGDLFDQTSHLVVGMCDTFDTSIPHIISRASAQGGFLHRLLADDVAEFDRQLDGALEGVQPIGTVSKEGKTNRYPLGTVAVLRNADRCFFMLAYTEMNERNEAHATVDGIWRSLDQLWKEVGANSNGRTVAMPVIGGGQSRISQILPAQDSIRLVILSFMFASRGTRVCEGLDIIVSPKVFQSLDRLELQAFLGSLRKS